jgi:hypothetical protein
MSLQSIFAYLNARLVDGVISLNGTPPPDGLEGLATVLHPLGVLEPDSLVLSSATLSLGPDAVVLTGTAAAWRNTAWTATLTGRDVGGVNAFTLTLQGIAGPNPWTFGTSFPLPQSRQQAPDGTLRLVPSVLTALVVQRPLVTVIPSGATPVQPRFQGTLLLGNSVLQNYAGYFGSSLNLDGHVDLSTPEQPQLNLTAVAPDVSLTIPHVKATEAGLKLVTSYPDIFALEEDATISAALVYVKVQLGTTNPIYTETTAPLLQGDNLWPIAVALDETATLGNSLNFILEVFGVPIDQGGLFSFPLADTLLNKFHFSGVELGVRPPLNGQTLGLIYASVQLTSVESWTPSIPFVKLTQLGTSWTYHWYESGNFVTGNVWGRLTFFEDAEHPENEIKLLVSATIPDFIVTGSTEETITVPLGRVFDKYLGGSGPLPPTLQITRVMIQAMPQQQIYQASLMVEGIWDVKITDQLSFSLDRVIGEIAVSQSEISGSISGFFAFNITPTGGATITKTTFLVTAAYSGANSVWSFSGGLAEGTLSVTDFAAALLGFTPSISLPSIDLTELWFTYDTSTGNPYSARGALEMRWKPELLGIPLSLDARASVTRKSDATYEGSVSGTFTINRLAITAGLSFVGAETVYLFEVAYKDGRLRAVTEWVQNRKTSPNPTAKHQILTVSLQGYTLGDVVAYLISLVNPNANYQLDAPWSVLNSIDLSRFRLKLDPTDQTISLTYDIGLNLGFMSITSVGLVYDRSTGSGSVRFILAGNFLGKSYGDGAEPLSWDALNDPPPEVPGKGQRLFELNYLGLGQHVTLSGLTTCDSVTDVLAALRDEMQPVASPGANPLTQSKLQFDESSQWMFGIDCRIMETLSLALIMHDPDLYGIVISLAGPEAGSLAGLSFELLYKKVTDNIGVYRVRLQVPEAFRQIDFGAVSVTLGVITVDVFTNGNFMVDLGFPHNHDFTNSFGLQAGPFIGSGGIYFGVLDGATSKRVPAITNGTFDPVLELGIGLSVGIGRTFNKGPLKAGLYVEMVAIIEGVLGWFHPTDTSMPKAQYYSVRGTAGLVGKLYGSVDFVLIRVSVSVEAHAIVTFTFAAYQETLVELDVGVSVEAEIKVLFVTISFSFSLQLTTSFTIGENHVAPWTLAAGQSGLGTARQLQNVTPPRRLRPVQVRALTRQQHLLARHGPANLRVLQLARSVPSRLAGAPAALASDLHWSDSLKVFPDQTIHPVKIKLLPAYTCDQMAVQWPQQPVPAASAAYRIAFILMADYAAPPGAPARTASSTGGVRSDLQHARGSAPPLVHLRAGSRPRAGQRHRWPTRGTRGADGPAGYAHDGILAHDAHRLFGHQPPVPRQRHPGGNHAG